MYLVKNITLLTTLYSKEYLFNYLKKHCCLHLKKVINLFKNLEKVKNFMKQKRHFKTLMENWTEAGVGL